MKQTTQDGDCKDNTDKRQTEGTCHRAESLVASIKVYYESKLDVLKIFGTLRSVIRLSKKDIKPPNARYLKKKNALPVILD